MRTARLRRALPALVATIVLAALLGPARARAQGDGPLYLPLVARPAVATLAFATGVNPESGEPIAPGTAFPGGTDLIYVAVRLEGYAGRSYRVDFAAPDGQKVTGASRSILSNDFRAAPSYCFTTSTCELDRSPLPGGVYTVELFVDGALAGSGQFTVQ